MLRVLVLAGVHLHVLGECQSTILHNLVLITARPPVDGRSHQTPEEEAVPTLRQGGKACAKRQS